MSLVRVHNFSIALDGFGAGEGQSKTAHFGHAGERLHEWMFDIRWWQAGLTATDGSGGVDDAFAQRCEPGIGAKIMEGVMFGHPGDAHGVRSGVRPRHMRPKFGKEAE